MISTPEFEQMKDGVVLVNTARGAVIDERALVKALRIGKVSSVGLDVYEEEPSIHPDLIANPDVILLPHMGTWSVEVSLHDLSHLPLSRSPIAHVHRGFTLEVSCAACGHGSPAQAYGHEVVSVTVASMRLLAVDWCGNTRGRRFRRGYVDRLPLPLGGVACLFVPQKLNRGGAAHW